MDRKWEQLWDYRAETQIVLLTLHTMDPGSQGRAPGGCPEHWRSLSTSTFHADGHTADATFLGAMARSASVPALFSISNPRPGGPTR